MVVVQIIDRGPYVHGRIVDLSPRAAEAALTEMIAGNGVTEPMEVPLLLGPPSLVADGGHDTAVAARREALRDWGRYLGQGLARHAPAAFDGLARDFVHAPDGGRMFEPAVHRCDSSGIDTQMMRCPLKQAWQAALVEEVNFDYSGYILGNYLDAQLAVNQIQLADEQSEIASTLCKVFTAAFPFDTPVTLPQLAPEPLLQPRLAVVRWLP
jgi:hypothetical protein